MTTGAKIAIGCGIVLLLGAIGVTVAMVGGAYWVKGKAEQFTGEQKKITELEEKANANSFDRPADSVVPEPRLRKFLEIRKRVFDVYSRNEPAIAALKNKKEGGLSDVRTTFNIYNEIRLAQAQAQADLGMSDDEYQFLVEQVYKSMWASEVAKSIGGKSVSGAASEMFGKAAEEMRKAAAEAEAAKERAEAAGGSKQAEKAAGKASGDMKEAAEEMEKQADRIKEGAAQLDVPPANIALFQKYEADIKKYAMSGLEWIGL